MQATKTSRLRSREQRTGLFLLLPAVILLLLVFAYPIGRSFWLSLFDQNLATGLKPVFRDCSITPVLQEMAAFGQRFGQRPASPSFLCW